MEQGRPTSFKPCLLFVPAVRDPIRTSQNICRDELGLKRGVRLGTTLEDSTLNLLKPFMIAQHPLAFVDRLEGCRDRGLDSYNVGYGPIAAVNDSD